VNKLIQGYKGFGYCLFFNNFFSNLPMIKRLLKKKFFACSTIRRTRKYFPHAQLRSDKDLKMGESDFIAAGDIGVAKWKEMCLLQQRFREGASSPNKQRREKRICVVS
jgi:hypothetical protein